MARQVVTSVQCRFERSADVAFTAASAANLKLQFEVPAWRFHTLAPQAAASSWQPDGDALPFALFTQSPNAISKRVRYNLSARPQPPVRRQCCAAVGTHNQCPAAMPNQVNGRKLVAAFTAAPCCIPADGSSG